jgi:hypothetical protein
MTDNDLDRVYTQLCTTMTKVGEANAPLFLGRFALLAIVALGDAAVAQRLIAEAGQDLGAAEPDAAAVAT